MSQEQANARTRLSWSSGGKVRIRLSRGEPVLVERCVYPSCVAALHGMLTGFFSMQVEVEVRRNVYGPENAERITSRFVGGETEVRNAVGDYLRWLKEDAHKRAEGLVDGIKSAEVEIKQRLSPKIHNRTLDPESVVEEAHQLTSEPAEDDWASDNSDTRASRPTTTKSLGGKVALPFKRKGSAKKKKYIRPSTVETPNISREHSKVRDDRSSTPSPHRYGIHRGTGIPVSRTASWDVGSPYYNPRAPSVHPDSRRGSIRNLRIESLRTAGIPGSPRELSPARSVRFADPHPPRTPLSIQDTSMLQSGPGDGDEDSPRTGKVAFELPSDKH